MQIQIMIHEVLGLRYLHTPKQKKEGEKSNSLQSLHHRVVKLILLLVDAGSIRSQGLLKW
jgi:hypothetical protein